MTELPEGTAAHRADAARFAVFRAAPWQRAPAHGMFHR